MYKDKTIKLLFAGDLIPSATSENIFSEALLDLLNDKDFSIVNLEAPLTLESRKIKKNGNNLKTHPDSIQQVVNGKFDAVSLSNNHIRDYGGQGVLETLKICKTHDIMTVGAGFNLANASKPLKVNIKEKNIVIFNYSEKEFNIATHKRPGASPFDLIDVYNQIKSDRANCDYIIVIYHGGLEHHHLPTPEIIKRFKFIVDAGADCVVSHHTHKYSGLIEYKVKPIFFGLGNFYFPKKKIPSDSWLYGLLARIEIEDDLIKPQLIPTKMASSFSSVNLLQDTDKKQIMNHIDDINKTIQDENALHEYWSQVFKADTGRIISLLNSGSRNEFRFRKRVLPLMLSKMTAYRNRNILNSIRCDSHRERLVSILERITE